MYAIVGEFDKKNLEKYEGSFFGKLLSVHSCGSCSSDENELVTRPVGWHDYMLIYITKGSSEVCINGKSESISVGDVAILPPKCPYEIFRTPYCEWLFVHFNKAVDFKEFGIPDKICFKAGESYAVDNIFRKLVNEMNNVDHNVNGICSSLLMHLLFEIGRLYCRTQNDIRFEDEFDYVLNVMETSALGAVEMKKFADLAGCSEPTFRRICKKRTGKTPKQYIMEKRAEKIKEMLEIHSGSIEELSASVGFRDYPYFSRFVKESLGLSPENYIKKIREEKYKSPSKK